jgi:Flp pilus assembly protein TadG
MSRVFMRRVRARRSGASDEGAAAIEVAILAPAILLILGLGIVAMRVEVAGEAVDLSAHDAARAASISRNGADAQAAATTAAQNTLAQQHLNCNTLTVTVDTSGFDAEIGQPASVVATVTCVVDLSNLGLEGTPGTKTMTSTFTSVIDQYGGRS